MKLNNKKGFTLIEIMIVIVIISLLAVTLVPKLTGAQARSRDASRTASLLSMKAVLTTIYDDFSEYPITLNDTIDKNFETGGATGNSCLSADAKGTVDADFSSYLDGGKTSFDPQKSAKVEGCGIGGSYGYTVLAKNGMNKAAFVLSAQTETYQKSNSIYSGTKISAQDGTIDITAINSTFKENPTMIELKEAEKADAKTTVYIVTGG